MADPDRDAGVSRRYRALGREEPPPELDAAILAASRRRHSRWAVPVSIAAVVVLAVGVTLRVQIEERKDAEDIALSPRVMQAPAPAAPPPAALSERAADTAPRQEVRGSIAPAAPAAQRLEPAGRSLAAKIPGKPETPEQWLERIARLRAQGKDRAADESLAEFKRRYPDYEIVEAMRARVERR